MKKLLALVLAMALLLSCSFALAEEEHGDMWIGDYEITWWIPMAGTTTQYFTDYNEHPFFQWMEEQTGVHVDFQHYSAEQQDTQLQLMIASNDYFDMLYDPWYTDGPQNAVNDGVFADIYQYKDLMPHYFEAVVCGDGSFSDWEWGPEAEFYRNTPQEAFDFLLTTVQGNMWTVSQIWTDSYACDCGGIIRKDWLDEAGLAIPQTLDELETVLRAFKENHPDAIPMVLDNAGTESGNGNLTSAFDFYMNWYYVKDGVIQPGYACGKPELKEYITLVNKWYQEGLVDQEFMTREWESIESKLLSDGLGFFPQAWAAPAYYQSLYTGEDPDYELAAVPLIRKDTEQQLHWNQSYGSSNSNNACICPLNGNGEICAQYLDKLFTKEAALRMNYGIEGESYVFDEEGHPYYTEWFYENLNDKDLTNTYLAPANVLGFYSVRAEYLRSVQDTTIEGQKTVASEESLSAAVWGENADTSYVIGYVTFDDTGWGDMFTPYCDAETYYLAEIVKMITGKTDISEFEAISQKAWDMGFKVSRELCQAAYNAQHQAPADFGMDYEYGT